MIFPSLFSAIDCQLELIKKYVFIDCMNWYFSSSLFFHILQLIKTSLVSNILNLSLSLPLSLSLMHDHFMLSQ
jgi:hypothetical protein